MNYSCVISNSVVRNGLKRLLNSKLNFVYNQSSSSSARCVSSVSARVNQLRGSGHLLRTLSQYDKCLRCSPGRHMSSIDGGPNKQQMDRQFKIFSAIILSGVLFVIVMGFIIEPHQDYVIIERNEK